MKLPFEKRPSVVENALLAEKRLARLIALSFLGYAVRVYGEPVPETAITVVYPHGEHPDSLLLRRQANQRLLSASEVWNRNMLWRVGHGIFVDSLPWTRWLKFEVQALASGMSKRQAWDVFRLQSEQEMGCAQSLLAQGVSLLLYPQGGRMGLASEPSQVFPSDLAFALARETGVALQPVVIGRVGDYAPSNEADAVGGVRYLLHRRLQGQPRIQARVVYMPPLSAADVRATGKSLKQVRERVARDMMALETRLRQGGEPPRDRVYFHRDVRMKTVVGTGD